MTTIRTLITDSLRDIQVIASEEEPTAAEAADSLRKFNRMMHGLGLEGIDTDWSTLTLDDNFPLDTKHERGVCALLSVELAPGFGREVDPAIAVTAERARGLLQTAYLDLKPTAFDRALRPRVSSRDDGFNFNEG